LGAGVAHPIQILLLIENMFHYPGKRNGIALPQAMDMIINNSDIIATAKRG
jgi:hypothetical protein